MKRFKVLGALLILIAGLTGCWNSSPTSISPSIQTTTPMASPTIKLMDITQATLENFTIAGMTLQNGRFQGDRTTSNLVEPVAFGDLNGDELKDAAVVLATNTGGSGTFYTLSAVLNQSGKPVEETYVEFGDRQKLIDLKIIDRRIILDYMTQGPSDPLCCPTQHVLAIYELENKELHLISYQKLGNK